MCTDILKNKIPELHEDDYDRLFELFDDDNTNSIDFREILCCLSIMTHSSISEKIKICF